MNRLSAVDIGWLAGIIEGEGYMSVSKYTYRLGVSMTDKDVIDRIKTVTGVGSVTMTKRSPQHKDIYNWRVSSPIDTMHIFASIVPLLGERRRGMILQMAESLNERRERKRLYQTFCTEGHLRTEENTHRSSKGYLTCYICSKNRRTARKPALSG